LSCLALAALALTGCGASVSAAAPKSASCTHLPTLIHSDASPGARLLSMLRVFREPATAIDKTPLGSWNRFNYLIGTVYQRYIRVFNGPRNVRVTFFPASTCPMAGPGQRKVSIVMLALSNPGENSPVLVGTAQQIEHGPGLAGIDIANEGGWLQAIMVPDHVARVFMKFTPPGLHPYSNTVRIRSNVGIVVRNRDYTPSTVIWYGKNGKVLGTFTCSPTDGPPC
jgi:hypothetical protein